MAETNSKMKIETLNDTNELVLERVFDAPRERVFDAWADCDAVSKWWGPRTWPVAFCEMDFRVGGEWLYAMKGPDGTESWGKCVYREIDRPSRLVFDDMFSDKDGGVNTDMPQMVMTVTFTDEGGKTKVNMHTKYPSAEAMKTLTEMGMIDGLTEAWDQLEELVTA